jgi:hypothetical protein
MGGRVGVRDGTRRRVRRSRWLHSVIGVLSLPIGVFAKRQCWTICSDYVFFHGRCCYAVIFVEDEIYTPSD